MIALYGRGVFNGCLVKWINPVLVFSNFAPLALTHFLAQAITLF